jgi:hypothetical protein
MSSYYFEEITALAHSKAKKRNSKFYVGVAVGSSFLLWRYGLSSHVKTFITTTAGRLVSVAKKGANVDNAPNIVNVTRVVHAPDFVNGVNFRASSYLDKALTRQKAMLQRNGFIQEQALASQNISRAVETVADI